MRVTPRLASNKVNRGEVLLEKMAPAVGLTACGKDWLTQALDPFHDNQLTSVSGWPDVVTNPSIVHTVKESFVITGPGVPNESWDAHLHVFPWLQTQYLAPMLTVNGNWLDPIPTVDRYAYSHISVISALSSAEDPEFGVVPQAVGVHLPSNIQSGRGRLIGMGIEAIDVSAELYKQGTITGYRSIGNNRSDPETWRYGYTGSVQPLSMFNIAKPPLNAGSAMILPGTRQWASKDGAYLVVPIDQNNEPELPKPMGCYFWENEDFIAAGSQNPTKRMYQQQDETSNTSTMVYNHLAPLPSTGLMWTGLNPESVIQIKVIWYYESFPGPSSPYATLAKPSCEYDPVALKLYTEVLNSLPIMVPSDWNPAGEWWWDVVSAIRENAEKVGSLFGGPGQLVGKAVSTLAGWGQDNYMTAPGAGKPKPKPQNQNRGGGRGQGQTVTKTVVQQNAPKRKQNAPRQQQGKKVTTTTVVTKNPNRK